VSTRRNDRGMERKRIGPKEPIIGGFQEKNQTNTLSWVNQEIFAAIQYCESSEVQLRKGEGGKIKQGLESRRKVRDSWTAGENAGKGIGSAKQNKSITP